MPSFRLFAQNYEVAYSIGIYRFIPVNALSSVPKMIKNPIKASVYNLLCGNEMPLK